MCDAPAGPENAWDVIAVTEATSSAMLTTVGLAEAASVGSGEATSKNWEIDNGKSIDGAQGVTA